MTASCVSDVKIVRESRPRRDSMKQPRDPEKCAQPLDQGAFSTQGRWIHASITLSHGLFILTFTFYIDINKTPFHRRYVPAKTIK